MSQGRLFLSVCLAGVLGCETAETKTEAAPLVGVGELPLVQRNGGNPPAGAAQIEIAGGEIRVDGETALPLEKGKVPAAEASGYVLPKLKAKLAGKSGLAITAMATTPYSTLARVIQTGFEAGAKELAFQVRKPGTTKDTGWLVIKQSHFTDTSEDGKFGAGELLPWDSFAKVWEESLNGCQASSRADCGYSPVAKAEGGELDMMLRVRGSGIALRMRQAGVVAAADAGVKLADKPKPKPKKARAEMLDGIKAAPVAEEVPPEPTTEHVFTLRADQATAVPSPVSGITRPICGSVTCPVVLDAEGISLAVHVLSLLGAAFPDGTPEPKVAWVLPKDLMFPVRKLRAQDIPATAALLAAAFADNPCYAFMHPGGAHDSPRRVDDLRAFFVRNLEWHLPLDLTWVACLPSGEPAGTVTLEPPAGLPTPLWGTLRHWVLPTLREQGLEGLRRILITDGEFRTAYRALCGEPRYWHVHAVAVAPEQQRAGIGGHMLSFVLERLEEQLLDAPAPVVLSTQREVNVGLYRRFGFELVTQQRLGQQRGQVGYPTWFMLHPRLSRTGPAL